MLCHKQFIWIQIFMYACQPCMHNNYYYIHVHVLCDQYHNLQDSLYMYMYMYVILLNCREYWTGLARSSQRSSSQWRPWGITTRFTITWASWRLWWLVCQSWGGSSYSHSVGHRTSTLPIFQTGELNLHVLSSNNCWCRDLGWEAQGFPIAEVNLEPAIIIKCL